MKYFLILLLVLNQFENLRFIPTFNMMHAEVKILIVKIQTASQLKQYILRKIISIFMSGKPPLSLTGMNGKKIYFSIYALPQRIQHQLKIFSHLQECKIQLVPPQMPYTDGGKVSDWRNVFIVVRWVVTLALPATI